MALLMLAIKISCHTSHSFFTFPNVMKNGIKWLYHFFSRVRRFVSLTVCVPVFLFVDLSLSVCLSVYLNNILILKQPFVLLLLVILGTQKNAPVSHNNISLFQKEPNKTNNFWRRFFGKLERFLGTPDNGSKCFWRHRCISVCVLGDIEG